MPRTRNNSALVEKYPAIYRRVSTDEQAATGLGLDDQRHRCFAMATVKGWAEPTVYTDEGISGTKDTSKRPGLRQLMDDVRAERISAVIVLDLSRLGRNTVMVLRLVEEMRVYDVAFISCKEAFDTTTPQGQFVLTMFAALGQLERDQTAERTRGALASLDRQGKDKGGRIPYGYVRVPQGFKVEPAAARWVEEIFALRSRRTSMQVIANYLNAHEVPTPRNRSCWWASGVREILENESAYRGYGSRGQPNVKWPVILEGVA
jgi:site-specific DNA recombinase